MILRTGLCKLTLPSPNPIEVLFHTLSAERRSCCLRECERTFVPLRFLAVSHAGQALNFLGVESGKVRIRSVVAVAATSLYMANVYR